jgi:polyphosphate kinase
MPRNLDRRVEALTPIVDPDLQFRMDEILDVVMSDANLAWEMDSTGAWRRISSSGGVDTHLALQDLARARASAHL